MYRLLILLFVIIILENNNLLAVPAYPYPIEVKQPDGTSLTLVLKGDEWNKWAETTDGYTLLKNNDKIYEYAIKNKDGNLVPSGIKASDIQKRTLQEQSLLSETPQNLSYSPAQTEALRQIRQIKMQESSQPEKAFPTTGSRELVCILIGFTDLVFTLNQSDFNLLFNQIGYNYDEALGSVRDFYNANSYNQLDLTVTVVGPYTAANNMAYYGGNDINDDDLRPRELITEAVNLANPHVNYADFDNDNDGNVDGVYVIYAGYGEEAGASDDAIWAHKWGINPVQFDGKWISTYSCSAEFRGNKGTGISRIGVICHEFGHVLGAPDYYDTNYATGGQYDGTGRWDMMAGGSWGGGDGRSPAHHNGYTKWAYYDWITPQELTLSGYYSLRNSVEYTDCFIFTSATNNEFWFIENRQQIGFDASIPGHGMIIYHVDDNGIASTQFNNTINATHPQYMYPVAANATDFPPVYGAVNSPSCPFPGTLNKTSFTDFTTPRAYSWAGQPSNKPITDISEVNGTITFTFLGGNAPLYFSAISYSSSSISLTWNKNTLSNPVLVAFSTDGVFGNPLDGNTYAQGNSIPGGGTVIYNGANTSFTHNGLDSNTRYYYRAWSVLTGNNYSVGVNDNTKTICDLVVQFPFNEDFSSGSLPDCWDNVDLVGNGQAWVFNNPGGRTINTTSASNGFAIIDSDFYGSGVAQNCELISPVFDFSNFTDINLQFEHYFNQYENTSSATLLYTANNGVSWNTIQSWDSDTPEREIFSMDLTTELEGQNGVRFKWRYTGSWSWYWAIDDVEVTASPMAGVPTDYPVSNTTIGNNETDCFNATNQLTVAGDSYPVVIENGGTATFIAGQSIRFLPGFLAAEGSTVSAYITTTASFCNPPLAIVAAPPVAEKSITVEESLSEKTELMSQSLKVYPNPNNGQFMLELTHFERPVSIQIVNLMGATVLQKQSVRASQTDIDLSDVLQGVYFVVVNDGLKVFSQKIVINN